MEIKRKLSLEIYMKEILLGRVIPKLAVLLMVFTLLECPKGPSPKLLGTLGLENSVAPITVTESNSATSVKEGVGNDTYTIVLQTEPTSDVTVSITFDTTQLRINASTTSPVQLTFTTSNWSTAQTVTIEALYDSIAEGTHTQTITQTSASSDAVYNGITIPSVVVSVEDTTAATVNGSFQSGNHTLSTASDAVLLGTAVDPTKAFVTCNAKLTSSNTNRAITCQLNGAGTQVIIQSGGGLGAVVDWYVMEYSAGATVQRGSSSLATSDSLLNVTLTTVATAKTFVIAYTRSSVAGTTNDENRTIMARLTSSTNLELTRHKTTAAATVEWQVIEFNSANVRSGTVTLANGNSNTTAALGNTVNLASSFLIFNYKAASAIGGFETDYYVRGSYSNSSTLSFTRRGNNQTVDISWFAVEMGDGTTVQSGSTTITGTGGGTNTSITDTLGSSVATTKSMIVFSNDTQSGSSSDATQDSGTYTSTFILPTPTNQIQFTRNNDENNDATLDWFVISFP